MILLFLFNAFLILIFVQHWVSKAGGSFFGESWVGEIVAMANAGVGHSLGSLPW